MHIGEVFQKKKNEHILAAECTPSQKGIFSQQTL